MAIDIKMPALSPTMEEGTLAKWHVKEGDSVSAGDLLAEIETDKATMEFEAVDDGIVTGIMIAEGTEGVKVGAVIATITSEGEVPEKTAAPAAPKPTPSPEPKPAPSPAPLVTSAPKPIAALAPVSVPVPAPAVAPAPIQAESASRIIASPLAKRLAEQMGVDLSTVTGTGPGGRIVKQDVEAAASKAPAVAPAPKAAVPVSVPAPAFAPAPTPTPAVADGAIPHEVIKLSGMRKTIARRLTESKQTVPHIYLTVDVRLDALLKLRGELNASLQTRGIKLSVNDMLIKALGLALMQVPKCNVSFAGDTMLQYARADISVAVSVPGGLITPIIADAASKSISAVSTEMSILAAKAKDGKLQPHEYQGGTASLSNMGMLGIKQFEAVINPPQAMIMAIGAGEKRPYIVEDAIGVATVMCATGSFDHRAIDGADGAMLMTVFKELVENPMGLVA